MFSELEVGSSGVLTTIIGLIILTIGMILYFKIKYKKYDYQKLESINNKVKSSMLNAKTKYPEVDVFLYRGIFLSYGMAATVAISLVTMSWTTSEKEIYIPDDNWASEDVIEMDVPRIAEPPLRLPPPPTLIKAVPDTEVINELAPKFLSPDVSEDSKIEDPIPAKAPPLPPLKTTDIDEIFKVVEQMPRFPGCEDKGTETEKDDCAKQMMLAYIYANLTYPKIAIEIGVEGGVVLQFVVDKDGTISETKIVRDIGAGCAEAAELVVKSMNNMGKSGYQGKQRGRPVKVLYTLPVKFKLER
ncbi:MAG: energy transducer TonB [Saprospiraceae bacterium]|nr:energy transducer TonB [Saprospiraceae bacterium]